MNIYSKNKNTFTINGYEECSSSKNTLLMFINEKEFSEITGQKLATIRSNRIKGSGCGFYKIGGSVRYKLTEVLEYLESCKCTSTTKKI